MTSKRFKKLPTKTTTIEPALIEKLIMIPTKIITF